MRRRQLASGGEVAVVEKAAAEKAKAEGDPSSVNRDEIMEKLDANFGQDFPCGG